MTNRRKKGRGGKDAPEPEQGPAGAVPEGAAEGAEDDGIAPVGAEAAEGAEPRLSQDRPAVSTGDPVADARRRALEDPSDPEPRLELARIYRERGDLALAAEQLESARQEAPENVDVLVELGITLSAQGKQADAEKELRRAQRLAPDRASVNAQLGIVLFKRGLYRQAEVELRRALDLDDQSGEAYFYRGEALNQLGRVDDALEMLERAVQYQPRNARAYYTMGILYDRKHLRAEATAMYRKAREVGAA